MKGYAKLARNDVRLLEFGRGREFNYVRGEGIDHAMLRRQLKDSVEIVITPGKARELKITNQSLLTWDDHWVDDSARVITDPGIEHLNLSRNELVYVNINTPRPSLTHLNLADNFPLQVLHLHQTPSLAYLDVSGCKGLQNITLGENKSIQTLLAKDCGMGEGAMEQLLRDFTPVITASANLTGAGVFRKQHSTLLDLRGNQINWANRRIASKIRLLLTNNWIVKWSNTPPAEIIPPQLYAMFVESEIGISKFK
jgi:hypothetical protein